MVNTETTPEIMEQTQRNAPHELIRSLLHRVQIGQVHLQNMNGLGDPSQLVRRLAPFLMSTTGDVYPRIPCEKHLYQGE